MQDPMCSTGARVVSTRAVHPEPYSKAEAFGTLALQAVWVRLHAQRARSKALCTLAESASGRSADGELGINAPARRGEW